MIRAFFFRFRAGEARPARALATYVRWQNQIADAVARAAAAAGRAA